MRGFLRGSREDWYTMRNNHMNFFILHLCGYGKMVGLAYFLLISWKLFLDQYFLYHSNKRFKILYGKKSNARGGSESSGILQQHHAIFIEDIDDRHFNNIYKIHIVGDTGTFSHKGVTVFNITEVDNYSDYHCHCIGHTNVNIYVELKDNDCMMFRNKSGFTCHDFAWYIVESYSEVCTCLIPVNLLLSGCIRWQHYLILLFIFLVFIQLLDWWLVVIFILIFRFYECYLYYDIKCALNHEIYNIKNFIRYLYNITNEEEQQLFNGIVTKDLKKKLQDAFLALIQICSSCIMSYKEALKTIY
jgi:hypothetical protein